MRGTGRRVVEAWTAHVSAQGLEDRDHRSRLSDACCSETSTGQYIIYNIKNGAVWKRASSCEKRLSSTCPDASSSPPPPPQEKRSTTYPKTLPHQISHHQCTYPGIDPIGKTPSINPVYRTTVKDSYPEQASDRALTPSRTRIQGLLSSFFWGIDWFDSWAFGLDYQAIW